ncbi:uncharacterized protein BJX67DRAFT_34595 [Aspergillus lucknowensis]|uniref:Uncharacterized protein n=1 Tax=Aspergillus lucknowensis TaxID=176173 RepID=A0ABR4LVZ3_9EURO
MLYKSHGPKSQEREAEGEEGERGRERVSGWEKKASGEGQRLEACSIWRCSSSVICSICGIALLLTAVWRSFFIPSCCPFLFLNYPFNFI